MNETKPFLEIKKSQSYSTKVLVLVKQKKVIEKHFAKPTLTHFWSMVFSRGIKWERWPEMG